MTDSSWRISKKKDYNIWTTLQSKTGYFVKYCSSGYIEIGYYSNGELIIPMSFVDLLTHYPNANNAKNRSIQIDTKKKYF